jgi:hypothetical protein
LAPDTPLGIGGELSNPFVGATYLEGIDRFEEHREDFEQVFFCLPLIQDTTFE